MTGFRLNADCAARGGPVVFGPGIALARRGRFDRMRRATFHARTYARAADRVRSRYRSRMRAFGCGGVQEERIDTWRLRRRMCGERVGGLSDRGGCRLPATSSLVSTR
jgi:hypothetical protein